MELLIHAGGRWRLVCPTTGRVEGWKRRAKFVVKRHGVLQEIPVSSLVRCVKGPPLHRIRQDSKLHRKPKSLNKDACIQTDLKTGKSIVSKSISTFTDTASRSPVSKNADHVDIVAQKSEQNEVEERQKNGKVKALPSRSTDDEIPGTKQFKFSSRESSGEEFQYKELIISEEDVILLRKFIETHNTTIDLQRFDSDDSYKTTIFYTINPMVRVTRCAKIAEMLKNHDQNAVVYFAKQLGLRSIYYKDNQTTRKKVRAAKLAALSRSRIEEKRRLNKRNKISEDSDTDFETKKITKKQKIIPPSTTDSDVEIFEQKSFKTRSQKLNDETKQTESGKNMIKKPIVEINLESSDSEGEYPTKTQKHGSEKQSPRKTNNEKSKKDKNFEINLESSDSEEQYPRRTLPNTTKTQKDDSEKQSPRKTNNGKSKNNRNVEINSESTDSEEEPPVRRVIQRDEQSAGKSRKKTEKDVPKNRSDEENHRPKEKKRFKWMNRVVVPKRSSVRPGREYSMLEDQAIVAWLSACPARERLVNGNRVWKELEKSYQRITGQQRSWHSLRNRYLRYILPSLGSLTLPPAQAQRLRANATLGEIKCLKKRRNSVNRLPTVISASSRVRKPALQDTPYKARLSSSSSDSSVAAPRVLRSSSQHTPSARNKGAITSKTHKSPLKSPLKSPPAILASRSSPISSPSYSEVTRRFATRNRSTPQHSPQPPQPQPPPSSPKEAAHHKRRLYNPRRPTSLASNASTPT